MNPNQKGARRNPRGVRLWTHTRALASLPYVAGIVRSLREHWLEVRQHRRQAHQLAKQPGRPDRKALLAHQECLDAAHRAEIRHDDALKELRSLGITSLDPIRGQVLFPFLHRKKLAWFLFDLFDETPLRFWRYQDEPVDVRRPINASEGTELA